MRKFNTAINGYDKKDVNAFVDEVTKEYESMLNRLKDSDAKIAALNEKLNQYQNLETTLNKAILVAEDSANQVKSVAREEARLIIEEAKKNASHIVNDALIKAEKTEIEVDNLKRSVRIYKARIKNAIKEQLTIVDDVGEIDIEKRG